MLLILVPLVVLIAILIKYESKGPVIFKQSRVGKNKRVFQIYKFRTMKIGTPDLATELIDPKRYVTKVGSFLRRSSFDEIPQLWNILKGDMSFVGPRPALYNQYSLIEKRELYGVHTVRPGITGLAQINGRDLISDDEKVLWDRQYVESNNMIMDLKIIIITIKSVIMSKNIKG